MEALLTINVFYFLIESFETTVLYFETSLFQGFLTVNGKRISKTDIVAPNGVIHFITDVIDTPAVDDCTKGYRVTRFDINGFGNANYC